MQHLLLAPISVALLGLPAAQDNTAAAPQVADPAKEASALLLSMAKANVVLEGELDYELAEREEDEDPDFGGAVFVDFGSPFGGGEPFTGTVEIVLRETGESLIQSESTAPGFTVYSGSNLVLKRTTYIDQPPAMAPVVEELVRVFDLEALAKEVAAAKVQTRKSGERTLYLAPLRATFFAAKPAAGQGGFAIMSDMMPRVLDARLELVVDAAGACQRLDIQVTRNDPQAEMMQGMEMFEIDDLDADGEIVVEGEVVGGAAIQIGGAPGDGEPIEAGTSTYSFHVLDLAPSERAARALTELGKIAREASLEGK